MAVYDHWPKLFHHPIFRMKFSADLCCLLIKLNMVWAAADRPGLQRFIHKWVGSEVIVQDQRILSGRVLDKGVQKVKEVIWQKVQGKLATGECNGWKNVAKSNVVMLVMTVDGVVSKMFWKEINSWLNLPTGIPCPNSQCHPWSKNWQPLVEACSWGPCLNGEAVWRPGYPWCTDDGPNGKKMQWLLQVHFPWLIVLLCWVHQINLIVGDVLGVCGSVTEDINHAPEVVKWFNNNSTALELLHQEKVLTFLGTAWALILLLNTWWTAHYLIVTHLLKLKQPLQLCWTCNEEWLMVCAGTKEELKEKAHLIQEVVMDQSFWYRLERYVMKQ